jgi:hypothetical protein
MGARPTRQTGGRVKALLACWLITIATLLWLAMPQPAHSPLSFQQRWPASMQARPGSVIPAKRAESSEWWEFVCVRAADEAALFFIHFSVISMNRLAAVAQRERAAPHHVVFVPAIFSPHAPHWYVRGQTVGQGAPVSSWWSPGTARSLVAALALSARVWSLTT